MSIDMLRFRLPHPGNAVTIAIVQHTRAWRQHAVCRLPAHASGCYEVSEDEAPLVCYPSFDSTPSRNRCMASIVPCSDCAEP